WEGNNARLGERAGPVRAIRESWGADSGTNVTKTETFYRDVITYHYHVRVHPIPPDGLYTSWDYNRGVVSKYYNTIKPDGVDINGMNDDTGNVDGVFGMPAYFDAPDPTFNAPTAVLNWEEVSGASDNGSLVYIVEIKGATTAENPAVVPYYRDDSCLDDGTGDDPVSRPWPGEASDDTRVMNGYCAAAGKPNGCHDCRSATDAAPCDSIPGIAADGNHDDVTGDHHDHRAGGHHDDAAGGDHDHVPGPHHDDDQHHHDHLDDAAEPCAAERGQRDDGDRSGHRGGRHPERRRPERLRAHLLDRHAAGARDARTDHESRLLARPPEQRHGHGHLHPGRRLPRRRLVHLPGERRVDGLEPRHGEHHGEAEEPGHVCQRPRLRLPPAHPLA